MSQLDKLYREALQNEASERGPSEHLDQGQREQEQLERLQNQWLPNAENRTYHPDWPGIAGLTSFPRGIEEEHELSVSPEGYGSGGYSGQGDPPKWNGYGYAGSDPFEVQGDDPWSVAQQLEEWYGGQGR